MFLSSLSYFCYHLPMEFEFERCAGCPGGECPASQFFEAVKRGDIFVKDLNRGRAPGEHSPLFIQKVNSEKVVLTCPGVACGMGDRATILLQD